MPTVDRYPAGTFCWSELATADPSEARLFYTRLLDWQMNGDAFSARGKKICSVAKTSDARWQPYLSVDDLEQTLQRAEREGARIVEAPSDAGTHRRAVLDDPSGARLWLWQAKSLAGAGLQGEWGTLGWFELATRDLERAEAFYAATFGWRLERNQFGPCTLVRAMLGEQPVGALLRMTDPWGLAAIWNTMTPHWYCYFRVIDCAASAAHVQGFGGRVLVETTPIPGVGFFAMAQDPAGALFGLIEMKG